uniref:Uncharacterized protein n=1 Tax=Ditylenchus dipsaci TaxID=166011 RepID=A0A915CXS0_9BILA
MFACCHIELQDLLWQKPRSRVYVSSLTFLSVILCVMAISSLMSSNTYQIISPEVIQIADDEPVAEDQLSKSPEAEEDDYLSSTSNPTPPKRAYKSRKKVQKDQETLENEEAGEADVDEQNRSPQFFIIKKIKFYNCSRDFFHVVVR